MGLVWIKDSRIEFALMVVLYDSIQRYPTPHLVCYIQIPCKPSSMLCSQPHGVGHPHVDEASQGKVQALHGNHLEVATGLGHPGSWIGLGGVSSSSSCPDCLEALGRGVFGPSALALLAALALLVSRSLPRSLPLFSLLVPLFEPRPRPPPFPLPRARGSGSGSPCSRPLFFSNWCCSMREG